MVDFAYLVSNLAAQRDRERRQAEATEQAQTNQLIRENFDFQTRQEEAERARAAAAQEKQLKEIEMTERQRALLGDPQQAQGGRADLGYLTGRVGQEKAAHERAMDVGGLEQRTRGMDVQAGQLGSLMHLREFGLGEEAHRKKLEYERARPYASAFARSQYGTTDLDMKKLAPFTYVDIMAKDKQIQDLSKAIEAQQNPALKFDMIPKLEQLKQEREALKEEALIEAQAKQAGKPYLKELLAGVRSRGAQPIPKPTPKRPVELPPETETGTGTPGRRDPGPTPVDIEGNPLHEMLPPYGKKGI